MFTNLKLFFSSQYLKASPYIFHFQMDVVVNSVSRDLNLKNGVLSGAILKAAGPELQQALNEKQSGTYGDVHMTKGFMLKSKSIYHAVVPSWQKDKIEPQKVMLCSLGFVFLVVCSRVLIE